MCKLASIANSHDFLPSKNANHAHIHHFRKLGLFPILKLPSPSLNTGAMFLDFCSVGATGLKCRMRSHIHPVVEECNSLVPQMSTFVFLLLVYFMLFICAFFSPQISTKTNKCKKPQFFDKTTVF